MSYLEFFYAYVKHCFAEGFSFDPWDIAINWESYKESPDKYEHLLSYKYQEEI